MNLNLQDKKVLFIGPVFYDYHTLIKKELESFGAVVKFFPERDYSFKFTIVNNFFNNKLNTLQERHYQDIFDASKGEVFDYLFVVRGYKVTKCFLEKIKNNNPKIQTIMYQWDSEKNNSFSHLSSHFDKIFSFDREDVNAYANLTYLPLFYTKDIEDIKLNKKKGDLIYDILYFGYFMPERYMLMLDIIIFAKQNNLALKTFLYMPFSVYIKELMKGNWINFKLVSFKPLNRTSYLSLLENTKAVFDTSSVNQTGLAMRVIETVGAGKKLITSNKNIELEPFYNRDLVFIFTEKKIMNILPFLKLKALKSTVNYSLKNWIQTIFSS